MNAKRYLTVRQTAERYPAFTQGSIRWIIFNKDHNQFASVIRKLGKKIVIDEAEFVAWVERGVGV